MIGQLLCSYQHFHLFTDKVTWKYLAKEKKKSMENWERKKNHWNQKRWGNEI